MEELENSYKKYEHQVISQLNALREYELNSKRGRGLQKFDEVHLSVDSHDVARAGGTEVSE